MIMIPMRTQRSKTLPEALTATVSPTHTDIVRIWMGQALAEAAGSHGMYRHGEQARYTVYPFLQSTRDPLPILGPGYTIDQWRSPSGSGCAPESGA